MWAAAGAPATKVAAVIATKITTGTAIAAAPMGARAL